MSTLQKLSELDESHIEEISAQGRDPQWLQEYRRSSFETYGRLPLETSPLYNKYTDARRLDPAQVLLPPGMSASDAEPEFLGRRIAELKDETSIIQVGTRIVRTNIPDDAAAKGVVISSIYDALNDSSNEPAVRAALESSDSEGDKFTALNNAAFNSGVFIHVPDGVQIDKPIYALVCLPQDGSSVISRNVIAMGDSAKATIAQEMYSPKPGDGSASSPAAALQPSYMEMLNTTVGANSRLDVTTLQMFDQSAVNFSTRLTDISQDAQVNWYSGLFGAQLSRYRIDYFLRGSGASTNDSEVVFGNADQSFDIQTEVNHEAPSTEGRVVEKSILRDKSKSLFKGMIRIKENAAKSNSFLSGRSILLDPDAKSDAIPGLEILTNDVKATHSASVAQIDEEQIFYLQSRCLSKEEAERTIVEGFLEPLSRRMSYQVRAWIAYLIESKWEGRELGINTDEELAKFVEVEETRYNEDAEIEQHYKYR
ncbi:MAG: Fe-S cluster assembly protein SufD [Nitrosopumilaceae archaeon]|nr:Fe-S cluster assembly protein SufD [Nitrosopumilaceae archaeon]